MSEEEGFPGLGWPIRGSFARYVGSLPDGRAALDGAIVASRLCGLVFRLADMGGFDAASGSGVLKFGGRIGFTGHFGMLRLDIAEPWLLIESGAGMLSIAGRSGAEGQDRFDLAAFRIVWSDAAHMEGQGEALALTARGAALFGGAYAEGAELDPFILRLAQ
ncbi:HtaA domain-containing protein [Sphingomonas sp. SRS2]|uniref:HtaA domain-containing protein n=1 Tax=Sphingomonas sp. SRS2 TaxID=133190 RepID=UPI00061843D4|nr:HtaA domain-containing protein [Sphingomonas sp. SRS2]KKC27002.1 hypothetical protein WP12_05955 [Sphingomonas sp. SRS2]